MANKSVSSAPLFGSSNPEQIRGIQKEINAATAEFLKDGTKRRELLRKIGAITEPQTNS